MPKQLRFDLPSVPALGREDFFVSAANATAVALIETWETWPARKLVLAGPNGSGKSHLAHVWAELSGAKITQACELTESNVPDMAGSNIAIEDVEQICGNPALERALFHLHNFSHANRHSILFTSQNAPNFWKLGLPDLASRMQATPTCLLNEPDDDLLAAILMKLFSDRQLLPTPETVPFMTKRMPRSFDAAIRAVSALDDMSMASGRPINRALAARVLDNLPI